MNKIELVDACMKQAEYYATSFNRRREYEWKVSFGLWVVILGSITVLRGHPLGSWVGFVVCLGYAFIWLRGLWVSYENDKSKAKHFSGEAEALLTGAKTKVGASPGMISWRSFRYWLGFLRDWSMEFQFGTTVLLVLLAYKLIN